MPTPAFDSSLPNPQANGYKINPIDQTIRTDMEVGASRSRRRTAVRQDKVALSWLLTDAQLTTFRTWFDDSTKAAGGAAWFTINIPVGATGLTNKTVKFVGAPTEEYQDGFYWKVSATIEVQG